VPKTKILDKVIVDKKRMGFVIQRVGLGLIVEKLV
jgi:hypothetical protein